MIETERLILRLMQVEEADALLDFEVRNRDVIEPVSGTRLPEFYTLSSRRRAIEFAQSAYANQEMIRFGIYLKDYGSLIGIISLNDILWSPVLLCANLGYSIDRAFQNHGYASEAVKAMVDYAFRKLHLHRIEAGARPSNLASQRVLEKNGFVKEGLARKNVQIQGKWEDHISYGLLNPLDPE